jgi:hypothetical protein
LDGDELIPFRAGSELLWQITATAVP